MPATTEGVARTAEVSACGRYRWTLTRSWAPGPRLTFVMLNPSTADAATDDPTIRRCIGFARRMDLAGITVVNLYAYRATQPADMLAAEDPVGPLNDAVLVLVARAAARDRSPLVAAWGARAGQDRVDRVLALPGFDALVCLGVTWAGQPRHPLYLPGDAQLQPWPQGRAPQDPGSPT